MWLRRLNIENKKMQKKTQHSELRRVQRSQNASLWKVKKSEVEYLLTLSRWNYPNTKTAVLLMMMKSGLWPQINHLSFQFHYHRRHMAFHCPLRKHAEEILAERRMYDDGRLLLTVNAPRARNCASCECVLRSCIIYRNALAAGSKNARQRSSIAVNNSAAWTFFCRSREFIAANDL